MYFSLVGEFANNHTAERELGTCTQYQALRAFSSSHTLGDLSCSRNFSRTDLIQRALMVASHPL